MQAEELDARMLGALIAGVRRAFPFVPAEEVEALTERHADQLFRIVHTAPFTVGLQVSARRAAGGAVRGAGVPLVRGRSVRGHQGASGPAMGLESRCARAEACTCYASDSPVARALARRWWV